MERISRTFFRESLIHDLFISAATRRVFLKRMSATPWRTAKRSDSNNAIERAVNLLSFIFAQIYFPTFSNSLKEIAGHLGFRWSGSPGPGSKQSFGDIVGRRQVTPLKDNLLRLQSRGLRSP